MRKTKNFDCGVGPAFEVIGGKWKAAILCELKLKPLRTGQLRRVVGGITEKMLIQQLRELETDGIVHRKIYPEVPPKVEYTLTDAGQSLYEALGPIAEWGMEHAKKMERRNFLSQ